MGNSANSGSLGGRWRFEGVVVRTVRGLVGLLGEALITLGVVLVLFVGWQLWWTDVVSDADAAQVVASMEANPSQDFVSPNDVVPGGAFAVIRIPRFGADYARPLYEGTGYDILKRGVGHYTGTAKPGEVGNFAMAGHRTTYGKPFNLIATLRPGDVVLAETKDRYYVYRVTDSQIVPPTQVSVVLPVPDQPKATPTQKLLTMTSCHPEFSARERYIVHAVLDASYTRDQGIPASVMEVKG